MEILNTHNLTLFTGTSQYGTIAETLKDFPANISNGTNPITSMDNQTQFTNESHFEDGNFDSDSISIFYDRPDDMLHPAKINPGKISLKDFFE